MLREFNENWYIVATEEPDNSAGWKAFYGERIGAKVTGIKASHLVFMSKPDLVAEVVDSAAKELSK